MVSEKHLSKYEADAVQKSAASAIEKGLKSANNLIAKLNYASVDLAIEQHEIDSCQSDIILTSVCDIYANIVRYLRMGCNTLYSLTTYPAAFQSFSNPQEELEAYYKDTILSVDTVDAILTENALYVKTPMLWGRNNRRVRGENGRTIGPERAKIYNDSVNFAIRTAPNFDEFDFSKFKHKIIHYLYVYQDFPANKLYLIDNDNHETKYTTDAITNLFPSGDTPLCCDFYSSAIISNAIPEGTYITVTEFSTGILQNEAIVNAWKEHLSAKAGK